MKAQLQMLEDDAVVVQFPTRSTFNDAWALREGQMKKRGDGSEKTKLAWDKAAKKVGQLQLLEALKKFLRETKEPTCGHPGLSVWLNGQRYDHWLPSDGERLGLPQAKRPVAPEPVRARCLCELGEAFVLSYLDPCVFHEDGWITPATEFARKKLLEKGKTLKASGLMGIRNKVP